MARAAITTAARTHAAALSHVAKTMSTGSSAKPAVEPGMSNLRGKPDDDADGEGDRRRGIDGEEHEEAKTASGEATPTLLRGLSPPICRSTRGDAERVIGTGVHHQARPMWA